MNIIASFTIGNVGQFEAETDFVKPGQTVCFSAQPPVPIRMTGIEVDSECAPFFAVHGLSVHRLNLLEQNPVPAADLASRAESAVDGLPIIAAHSNVTITVSNTSDKPRPFKATIRGINLGVGTFTGIDLTTTAARLIP